MTIIKEDTDKSTIIKVTLTFSFLIQQAKNNMEDLHISPVSLPNNIYLLNT